MRFPPTSVFDVAGGGQEISKLPSPQLTSAYQGGTVLKLNRVTFDADYYAVKFQNNYISYAVTNPSNPAYDLNEYYLGPDSLTQGFEAEASASLSHGLNVYANGTVGKATYRGTGVPSGLNVTDTPAYTQALGLTYQNRGIDLGIIEKRVGDYYDDNGSYHNQVYVAPYNNVNALPELHLPQPRLDLRSVQDQLQHQQPVQQRKHHRCLPIQQRNPHQRFGLSRDHHPLPAGPDQPDRRPQLHGHLQGRNLPRPPQQLAAPQPTHDAPNVMGRRYTHEL